MAGTPNARHVGIQFDENAEMKMSSGTSQSVATAAILMVRNMIYDKL
jgi:hypothetical protein